MSRRLPYLLLVLLLAFAACKNRPRNEATALPAALGANETAKVKRLDYKVMTIKGKAEFTDVAQGKTMGLAYRIDISRDSLILVNLSKMGIPMANMLISRDSVKMRIPVNQTAALCDYSMLESTFRTSLDFTLLQAMLTGELPNSAAGKPMPVEDGFDSYRTPLPPNEVYWIVNTRAKRLEKIRISDPNLGRSSECVYSEFKKFQGQTVATMMRMEATQSQTARIELHHSGIEFDKEKVNFRYKIPEAYSVVPCDSLVKQR